MKTYVAPFALAALTALAASGCATRRGYVRVAPPIPVVEKVVVTPGPGYVWIEGYHRWDGRSYIWVPGQWKVPPARYSVWVPGHWVEHRGRGWYWEEGHWRR